MTELRATAAQLRALGRSTSDRVLLVRAEPVWTEPARLQVGGRTADVVPAATVLAVRDALAHHRGSELLIVLTDRPETELGLDVLARVSRQQVRRLDPAELIRSELGLRGLDPKLAQVQHRWLLQAFVAARPADGWEKPPSGFLNYEDALRQVLERAVGLPAEPALDDVVEWLSAPGAQDRLRAAGPDVGAGVAAALSERVGGPTSLLLGLAAAGRVDDLVAAGVVARVLRAGPDDPDLIAARVRFDLELGDVQLSAADALAWADAAEAVVRRRFAAEGRAAVDPWLHRAEQLVATVGATAHRATSDVLPSGLDARLDAFGLALDAVLDDPSERAVQAPEHTAAQVASHLLAADQTGRLAGMDAALRLARRLVFQPAAPVPSLPSLAAAYVHDGAWVDRARLRVRRGDRSPIVAAAYSRLLGVVDAEREAGNREFAAQLAEWSRGEAPESAALLPLERVLDRIVAPLAASGPVLLAVVDGTSWSVALDLIDDARHLGWVRLQQDADVPIGVAALPTVTESSRTSLLCGRLVSGHAADEQAGFTGHPSLRAVPGPPPRLFHKAMLTTAGGEALAPDLRDAVADPAQRVVGVVINAVDDHLSRGQQIRVEWTTESVAPLGDLLVEAAAAGRTVVLVSDHGHVLDEGRVVQHGVAEAGERWRPADRPPVDGEVAVSGPRVLLGGGSIVAPASELIRYGPPKHGYHGGLAPQEVLVPIVVLARATGIPDGWGQRADDTPRWWRADATREEAPLIGLAAPAPPAVAHQPGLFDEPAPPAAAAARAGWIDALLASPVFAARRNVLQRGRIDDDRVATTLAVLDARGGVVLKHTLADDVGTPLFRLDGYLQMLAAALNVDGYAVLEVQGESVVLNRGLLLTQFGVDG